jgi:hypothetical protein
VERLSELEAIGVLGLLSMTSSTSLATDDDSDHPPDRPKGLIDQERGSPRR